MTVKTAEHEIACMQAVLATLRRLEATGAITMPTGQEVES